MGFGYDMIDNGFGIFGVLFVIVWILIIGVIIASIVRNISIRNKNNQSPRLTVNATVVSKRTDVTYHRNPNSGDTSGAHGYYTTSFTHYYVTFQVESGDRMEFPVSGAEYAMLADGDNGKLYFQGTRYLNFERF